MHWNKILVRINVVMKISFSHHHAEMFVVSPKRNRYISSKKLEQKGEIVALTAGII